MHCLDSQVAKGTFLNLHFVTKVYIICLCPHSLFSEGAWKHDLTKYKAPEYSFGIRHEQSSSDCSPGPKYLIPSNVTRLGTDGSPTFVCSSRTSGSRLYQTPGPGKQLHSEHNSVILNMSIFSKLFVEIYACPMSTLC